ncbi:rCG63305 [Rattus norvegicus]|uniref:RCG63305 n=1 Tax=Rattus norvegicus TaxID=10116 RepID=A6JKV1_RAT|nr:rCG63305 [Rattus norvegicus]
MSLSATNQEADVKIPLCTFTGCYECSYVYKNETQRWNPVELELATIFRTRARHSLSRQILNNGRICFFKAQAGSALWNSSSYLNRKGHCWKNN